MTLAFPKPAKRITDPRAVALYARQHSRCEVDHCANRRNLETHHIVSRKMGGGDVPANLLRLCPSMHTEWHTVGGREWFRRYAHRLSDDARTKVMRALRIEDAR